MAAISVSVFEPVPGKAVEALGLMREAQEIITGLGSNVQVATLVRGGVQGQLNIIVENDDAQAYGAALDRLYADAGFQQFTLRAQASNVATPVRSVDYVDIPGLELTFDEIASAGVIMASLFVVRNGKQQESLERIQRSKALLEKQGAKTRTMQAMASDPFGLTAAVAYYENFAEWGRIGKALAADPEWQAFAAEIRGENASSDFLRSTLYRIV
jgi:hypothetical protein